MKCAYPQKNWRSGLEYPCGQCTHCRINKRRAWTLRNMLELEDWSGVASFVTLTYDEDHIPYPALVNRRDPQLFFKLLRYKFGSPLRYFGCAEYGGRTHRPHYHFIIYGMAPELLTDGAKRHVESAWPN